MKHISQKHKKNLFIIFLVVIFSVPLLFAAPLLDSLFESLAYVSAIFAVDIAELSSPFREVLYTIIYAFWVFLVYKLALTLSKVLFRTRTKKPKQTENKTATEVATD